MSEIKLIKQSYNEARNSGLVGRLELIELVVGASGEIPFSPEAIEDVNEQIIKKAREIGADYVFGIEYKAMAGSHQGGTMGYGDAYKK